nr:hypothetical protein [Tanacetum cinerariifolium]
MDTCTTLTRRVEHLELDNISQALEITKLKQKVKKLERRNKLKILKLRRLKWVGSAQRIDNSDDTVMDDDVAVEKYVDVEDNADIQGRKAESQAQIYQIDLKHANKVLSMQDDEGELAELQEVVEEPRPLKKQAQIKQDEKYARELEAELNKNIDWDEVIDHVKRKQKEDNAIKRYQTLKRKPQTEAQAQKNIMIYLRIVAGFKMEYFKRMTYDDIRTIFEKHFDSNVAFLQKTKEQTDEEDSKALKRLNEIQEDKAAKKPK